MLFALVVRVLIHRADGMRYAPSGTEANGYFKPWAGRVISLARFSWTPGIAKSPFSNKIPAYLRCLQTSRAEANGHRPENEGN